MGSPCAVPRSRDSALCGHRRAGPCRRTTLSRVDEDEVFERYRALLRSTSAFGDALALSGRTRRRFSDASHLAAENLLEKAYRAWREHPPRAAAYVVRQPGRLVDVCS